MPCTFRVELHLTTHERRRREPPKYHVGVGNGRLRSTPTVSRRTWFSTGAARADVQRATLVQPGDAAAAGANFHNVQHRDANREAGVVAANKIIRRQTRLTRNAP